MNHPTRYPGTSADERPSLPTDTTENSAGLPDFSVSDERPSSPGSAPSEKPSRPDTSGDPTEGHLPAGDTAKSCGILFPAAVLCLCFLVGLLWFLRPDRSETEKRELTDFPSFTWESFLSGKLTDQVSLWYSDTYPGREGLIRAYHGIQSLFGIRTETLQGSSGDEVPDQPMNPDIPDFPSDGGDGGGETVNGFYVNGDTAYELYAFDERNARMYAALINRAAEELKGQADVYDLVIPLSYTFHLSESTQKSIGVPDARKVLDYVYSGMKSPVHTVDCFPDLMSHRDEYIYFRTDHHWTATGAYYAYCAFCRKAGLTPMPLSSYQKLSFEGFLGTLYAKTGEKPALKNHPDTVEAYVPMGTNAMITHTRDGKTVTSYPIVRKNTDQFYQAAASKYNCFLSGDHPLIEIRNERVAEARKGTSVLLVKESFGNAFAPFLVDQYEFIYVLDYRYFTGNLRDFVTQHHIQTVLFLNNVVAVTASPRLREMESFIGRP